MKNGYLQARGLAFRHNAFDPSRKTLVFIHGLSGSSSAWKPYENALESSYNLVTYDLRGHGLSHKFRQYSDYELKNFADDLHALVQHLKITDCSIVAHSMGATVAVTYLHYHPGSVTSLLFLAPRYKQHVLAGTITNKFVNLAVDILTKFPFTPRRGHRLDYAHFGYSPDISFKRIVPEIRDMSLRLYLYCLSHLYAFTNDKWWRDITLPTTIVHGTNDFFVPYRFAVELAHAMPRAHLVTIKGANHMLVINNRDEILEAILTTTE